MGAAWHNLHSRHRLNDVPNADRRTQQHFLLFVASAAHFSTKKVVFDVVSVACGLFGFTHSVSMVSSSAGYVQRVQHIRTAVMDAQIHSFSAGVYFSEAAAQPTTISYFIIDAHAFTFIGEQCAQAQAHAHTSKPIRSGKHNATGLHGTSTAHSRFMLFSILYLHMCPRLTLCIFVVVVDV